ncbi:hypothetical protein [Bradyrhizobium iriomotense]|uniref:Uncharacterized protein n=1 Tax=Bradyrhizobium iriomotense TaxID=441950 RepID=A0ABQ6B075_9BRAD|nr:hypothetical protein [Bradyrhizobium iriomotense]GLR85926.1 hypothetical protein GCM10007857_26370 [Bradyrhizobium iriomotense]
MVALFALAEAIVALGLIFRVATILLSSRARAVALGCVIASPFIALLASVATFGSKGFAVFLDRIGMLTESLPALYLPARMAWDPLVTIALFALYFLRWRRSMPSWKAWLTGSSLWLIWVLLPLAIDVGWTPGLMFLYILAIFTIGLPVHYVAPTIFESLFSGLNLLLFLTPIPGLLIVLVPSGILFTLRRREDASN